MIPWCSLFTFASVALLSNDDTHDRRTSSSGYAIRLCRYVVCLESHSQGVARGFRIASLDVFDEEEGF